MRYKAGEGKEYKVESIKGEKVDNLGNIIYLVS